MMAPVMWKQNSRCRISWQSFANHKTLLGNSTPNMSSSQKKMSLQSSPVFEAFFASRSCFKCLTNMVIFKILSMPKYLLYDHPSVEELYKIKQWMLLRNYLLPNTWFVGYAQSPSLKFQNFAIRNAKALHNSPVATLISKANKMSVPIIESKPPKPCTCSGPIQPSAQCSIDINVLSVVVAAKIQ